MTRAYTFPLPGESSDAAAKRLLDKLEAGGPDVQAALTELCAHLAFTTAALPGLIAQAAELPPRAYTTAAWAVAWRLSAISDGRPLSFADFTTDFTRRFGLRPLPWELELATKQLPKEG